MNVATDSPDAGGPSEERGPDLRLLASSSPAAQALPQGWTMTRVEGEVPVFHPPAHMAQVGSQTSLQRVRRIHRVLSQVADEPTFVSGGAGSGAPRGGGRD